MDAHEFLEMAAGERCSCGHTKAEHDPPSGDVFGEVMGACRAENCECEGVIDAMMGD